MVRETTCSICGTSVVMVATADPRGLDGPRQTADGLQKVSRSGEGQAHRLDLRTCLTREYPDRYGANAGRRAGKSARVPGGAAARNATPRRGGGGGG